ncbi:hypothetical protein J2T10_003026 [Paenarthrobacter nicotinovorans]|uniref:Restriction endonuclease n=1 Tax=Paenarthrobacter nicotinovorans TaxID=29320 RepID=A0ABT9TSD6_PAENI|nr:restriction endonuclease [Paenarthrobacter nicotinovorans]MDQ0103362.1 hypothetical protein [Paenarthrobacter nicotinovorans]GAT86581.1 hypothetical protein CVCC1112_1240 [Paenarthrobacter nicotinovorans]
MTRAGPYAGGDSHRERLSVANLFVDTVYVGGRRGNGGDDAISPLLGVSNMGGFRYLGSLHAIKMLVLSLGAADPSWPDSVDRETGAITYFGDNKEPGRGLHDTPRHGNEILRDLFNANMADAAVRARTPPIFVFEAAGVWRDAVFVGLAVPGGPNVGTNEDLVAIWRTKENRRFQNYRASFTVLDTLEIKREWIQDIQNGVTDSIQAPDAWVDWVCTGIAKPLIAPGILKYRRRGEQIPDNRRDLELLEFILQAYAEDPYEFEKFAAAIVRLMLPHVISLDLTRRYRDGGRDGIGALTLGPKRSSILVEFAVEAKCYSLNNSVGVKEVSRLISRIRHRQFGIIVTTSFLNQQAYREIVEDEHPIIVVCGKDVVDILRANNLGTVNELGAWILSLE